MDHQIKFGDDGKLYQDPTVDEFGIIDVDGYTVIEDTNVSDYTVDDVKKISHDLMVGKSETLPTTEGELRNRIEHLVEAILEKQVDSPFKKGGESIAWNPDFLLFRMRQQLTPPEQTLFDIISGIISSDPARDAYQVVPSEVKRMLKFNDNYTYDMLKTAQERLEQKKILLEFSVGEKRAKINLSMFEAIGYVEDKGGNGYIAVVPSSILRLFLSSATIIHGGYYSIVGASQIQSTYTRMIYYLLESRKNFRETPRSDPGKFTIMLSDLQTIVGYPKSYRYADVKSKILDPAKKTLDEIEDIDITFLYEKFKGSEGTSRRKTLGISVWVIPKNKPAVEGKTQAKITQKQQKEESSDVNEVAMEATLSSLQYSDKEIRSLINACKKHERDLGFLIKAAMQVESQPDVKSKGALLMSFIKEGGFSSTPKTGKKKADSFHNFKEREYEDMDEIEKKLLNKNRK